tara:strand:+ start:449 stop:742 length:294 start_codon:yes stop_codon:yes gene_type:complete
MNNKKVTLLGFPSPIRMRDKSYVLHKLYDRAHKNPFIQGKTYVEYKKFLCSQIKNFGDKDVSYENDNEIYDNLKRMGWIRIVSAVLMAVVHNHTAVS